MLLQKSNVAGRLIFREITKREAIADSHSLTHISEVACECPPHLYMKIVSAARRISDHQCKTIFATWGNSGIEPDKGMGISFPGTYEANLMWPCNDGERQWNTMSDWTCR
jgi:hypothetical protein